MFCFSQGEGYGYLRNSGYPESPADFLISSMRGSPLDAAVSKLGRSLPLPYLPPTRSGFGAELLVLSVFDVKEAM